MNAVPELRFPEFDGEWCTSTLGNEAMSLNSLRVPLKEGDRDQREGEYPYYGASGVIDYVDDYLFDEKIVLLAEDGANILSRSTPVAFLVVGKSWVNNHAHVFRAKGSPEFLATYLENLRYEKYNTGTVQPKLNAQECSKIPVNFPPLPEQQKIAAFHGAVDDKIDALRREHDAIKQFKAGLMQKLFSQELRFKRDDGSGYPDWEEKRLGDVARVYDGTHQTPKYQSTGVPFFSVEHVTANQFENTKFIAEDVFEAESKRVIMERGDTLMTRIGDIGTSRFIDWDVRASFYVSLALIKVVEEDTNPQFLCFAIQDSHFQRELHRRTIHVAFPKKINLGEISNCNLLTPAAGEEQQKIADCLSAVDAKIEAADRQIAHMDAFKKGLLQKMFV